MLKSTPATEKTMITAVQIDKLKPGATYRITLRQVGHPCGGRSRANRIPKIEQTLEVSVGHDGGAGLCFVTAEGRRLHLIREWSFGCLFAACQMVIPECETWTTSKGRTRKCRREESCRYGQIRTIEEIPAAARK